MNLAYYRKVGTSPSHFPLSMAPCAYDSTTGVMIHSSERKWNKTERTKKKNIEKKIVIRKVFDVIIRTQNDGNRFPRSELLFEI